MYRALNDGSVCSEPVGLQASISTSGWRVTSSSITCPVTSNGVGGETSVTSTESVSSAPGAATLAPTHACPTDCDVKLTTPEAIFLAKAVASRPSSLSESATLGVIPSFQLSEFSALVQDWPCEGSITRSVPVFLL